MAASKTFFIHTFGCQMNVLDSEKAAGLLVSAGWRKAARPHDADLILYNTCCVREKPVQKVFSYLGQTLALKAGRPKLRVGVLGCVAQQQGWEMMKQFAGLDLVLGTRKIHRLTRHLDDLDAGRIERCVDVDMDDDPMPVETDTILRETTFRAFVTIMEGCDNFCAYCVVPHTRGRERSRPSGRILEEIRRLVADGAVEIMLLGQNVNSYRDPAGEVHEFADLLAAVAAVPGLRRLRFTTSHPKDFNPRLLQVMEANPVICNQLHLPAQSGSNRILMAMNRKYTADDYLAHVAKIRPISLSAFRESRSGISKRPWPCCGSSATTRSSRSCIPRARGRPLSSSRIQSRGRSSRHALSGCRRRRRRFSWRTIAPKSARSGRCWWMDGAASRGSLPLGPRKTRSSIF